MATCTVGNYRLVDKLGEGGMGAVYRAVDLMVEREVAIKMLRPEIARQPGILERFRAEAVALAKLNHPNIATLYAFFREADEYYMVMEFVPGHPLDEMLRESPPLRPEHAVSISCQVLDAIEHAHSFGILHRDIKPANIMVTASGQVKVTDFGIARVLGTARMTQDGLICGTLEYLAPERIRGQEADIRSDLYSFGVVLYEMLTHHLPFERQGMYELMRAHLEEPPPPFATFGVAAVPAQLEAVVMRTLSKHTEQRFGTAQELRSALVVAARASAAQPAPIAPPVVEPTPLPDVGAESALPPPVRRWPIYAAIAAVLIVVGIILAWQWTRPSAAGGVKKAATPPVQTQPSQPEAQPASPGEAAPSSASDLVRRPPAVQESIPATRTTSKPKPAATNVANSERRKAALHALEKNDRVNQTSQKKTDRRSSSLKALNK